MKTAVVICPGRGTYNATELGYLRDHFPDPALLAAFDARRASEGQETLSALDGSERFALSTHSRGDNASALIFAASYGDYLAIDRSKIKVVAVTGNSMGWYTTLACGGALAAHHGFRVVNTMGTLMQHAMIGGQTIYPWMDESWTPHQERRRDLLALVSEIDSTPGLVLKLSIDLGGMLVLAGNELGLKAFERAVEPTQGRFPMRLTNHAAFHTELQAPVAEAGRESLPLEMFGQPASPMIDGDGKIWWPGATDIGALYEYTLGRQVTQTYNFSRAITVAAREFAPDLFVILGPGATLGGAVAQSLIIAGWSGIKNREDFRQRTEEASLLVSMGMQDQRGQVVR